MTRSIVAALAIAIVPACTGSGTTTIEPDDPVGDTQDEGFAKGVALADHASDELSGDDYLVIIGKTASILAALNDGEIDQASFAIQVVDADDVFQFANDLIIDHEDLNLDLDSVVRFYGVGYLPSSAADALAGDLGSGVAELRATPPGDVDFVFVELQVINHAEAQVLLDELSVQVGPGAMGDYIADVSATVDLHLGESSALLDTFY
ncbi:MAG TPA: DUF4142 domain-containing protein [Kofleriaceae bacterium]